MIIYPSNLSLIPFRLSFVFLLLYLLLFFAFNSKYSSLRPNGSVSSAQFLFSLSLLFWKFSCIVFYCRMGMKADGVLSIGILFCSCLKRASLKLVFSFILSQNIIPLYRHKFYWTWGFHSWWSEVPLLCDLSLTSPIGHQSKAWTLLWFMDSLCLFSSACSTSLTLLHFSHSPVCALLLFTVHCSFFLISAVL